MTKRRCLAGLDRIPLTDGNANRKHTRGGRNLSSTRLRTIGGQVQFKTIIIGMRTSQKPGKTGPAEYGQNVR